MRPQPQPLQNCKTGPSRTSLCSGDSMGIGGRGTTTTGPKCGLTTLGAPKCVILFFLFFLTHRTPFTRGPVGQLTGRTHDAIAREGKRPRRTSRWSPLRTLNPSYRPLRSLPLEGDMFPSPAPCLSHYLHHSAFIAVFFE